jgi:hypothetical protein
MLTEQERESVREFYRIRLENMTDVPILELLVTNIISYLQLGNEDDGCLDIEQQEKPDGITESIYFSKINGLPNAIKIKRPNLDIVPRTIIDSFDRHIWYSRYCLTDIYVVDFYGSGFKTFALYIQGYYDDGWDNLIYALEVYDADGDFMFSIIRSDECLFKEEPITDKDFGGPILPPPFTPELAKNSSSPIWIDKYGGFWVLPVWSEEEVCIVD